MTTEAELRRIWGANFDANMESAVTAFDSLSKQHQDRIINDGGVQAFEALRLMQSEAYTNPKHPDHQRASQLIQEHHTFLFGSEPPEVF